MAVKRCDYNGGILRTAATFEKVTRTSDGAGGFSETWAPIHDSPRRVHIESKGGNERYQSDRVEARANYRIVCRYDATLNEAHRVLVKGRYLNIRYINDVDMEGRWLEIDAEAGVAS
jgi:SPP1 family predicted phage head-tail adaptor